MTASDRTRLLSEASSILRKSTFTKEDSSRVESLLALADRYTDQTELRRAAMRQRDIELGRAPRETSEASPADEEFRSYLSAREQAVARSLAQQRAQSTDTTAGGYLVPQSFSDRVESALKSHDGLFDASTLFSTKTGSATGYPVMEDTANASAVVAENAQSTAGPDLIFATVAFGACPMWRSGLVRASVELVDDSNFDFGALLANAVATRFARGCGATFVSTLLSSASSGVTAQSATVIASDEIFTLIDSVDESYGTNGSFLMRRSTLTALRKLKTTSGGEYTFPEARDAQGYPTLLGYRVYISPSMGAMSTGAKPISFGDHSKFVRREVANSLAVKSYVERFAEFGQVGFEGFWRVDGNLLKSASTVPVKFLTMG